MLSEIYILNILNPFNFDAASGSVTWIRTGKDGSGSRKFLKDFLILFNKAEFSNFLSYFFPLTSMLKFDKPIRNQKNFYNLSFSIVQIWV